MEFRNKCWSMYGITTFLIAICAISASAQGWVSDRKGLSGKDLNAVYFVDSKRGWIAGDSGFVSFTVDGGNTWARQKLDTKDAVNDIFFRNKDDGYLLAGNRIFNTTDGGQTWREMKRFVAADFGGGVPELYSVRFANKKRGWVIGSISRREQVVDSLVLYTNDGGATWERRRAPSRSELIHLDFSSDERGWVVGASGTILYTRDAGETWTIQNPGTKATLYHVNFRNKEKGWAVGERGTILLTNDSGSTWRIVNSPVRSTLLSVKFVNDNEGWIVGRGGVILRSTDGGRTWERQESKTQQHLYALFMDKRNGWAVGADGLVLKYGL